MNPVLTAEEALRDGRSCRCALKLLQDQVRARPGDAKLRVFLFQLLCVLGQWERALNQLDTAPRASTRRRWPWRRCTARPLHCELLRAEVFGGRKAPMVFGEPDEWLALLIEVAAACAARASADRPQALRDAARSRRPRPRRARIDGQPLRLDCRRRHRASARCSKPIINGRYYWVPFARLSRVDIEAPEDLRDVVWMPAHLQFENGGETVGADSDALPRLGGEPRTD